VHTLSVNAEWTPEEVQATRTALNIVAAAQFGGTDLDGTANVDAADARIDQHLGSVESAAKLAVGAVDVCGLLLEYINQLQAQFREMLAAAGIPGDDFNKTPQQVLKFISDRLPS
jgi:hypothetical protein